MLPDRASGQERLRVEGRGRGKSERIDGRLQTSSELLLVIKTREGLFTDLEAEVNQLHPYDVPEIVAVRATNVNQPYLNWVRQST